MLAKNFEKRISAKQAYDHPWIKKFCGKVRVSKRKAIKIFQNIDKYKPINKFQHATWVLIVSRFADKKEKRDIKSIFEALDTDADGELTPEDL